MLEYEECEGWERRREKRKMKRAAGCVSVSEAAALLQKKKKEKKKRLRKCLSAQQRGNVSLPQSQALHLHRIWKPMPGQGISHMQLDLSVFLFSDYSRLRLFSYPTLPYPLPRSAIHLISTTVNRPINSLPYP